MAVAAAFDIAVRAPRLVDVVSAVPLMLMLLWAEPDGDGGWFWSFREEANKLRPPVEVLVLASTPPAPRLSTDELVTVRRLPCAAGTGAVNPTSTLGVPSTPGSSGIVSLEEVLDEAVLALATDDGLGGEPDGVSAGVS